MERLKNMSKEQIEEVIQLFNPYMDDYLYIMDLQKDKYSISKHAAERFNVPAASFDNAAEAHRQFVYEEDHDILFREFEYILSGRKKAHNLHYRWIDRNGLPIWINCRGGVLDDEEGRPLYLVGCINETGKKQRADNTSGLLSVLEFSDYISACRGKVHNGFLMRIGIDDFSAINSISGITYGDYVLKKVADCMKECLSGSQRLFHLVSDEYMVVDLESSDRQEAVGLYKRIRNKITEFIDEEKYKAVFTISAGVIDASIYLRGYDEMMKLSDFTLKQAKKSGKNNVYVYNQDDYDIFLRKKHIVSELQYAVDNNFEGFAAFFQPIVNSETSNLTGAETLMRFFMRTDDGMQMISPIEFIPLLEETGLILPAGKWILREAVAMCSEMQKYIPDFRVNVNISYIQVVKSDILKD